MNAFISQHIFNQSPFTRSVIQLFITFLVSTFLGTNSVNFSFIFRLPHITTQQQKLHLLQYIIIDLVDRLFLTWFLEKLKRASLTWKVFWKKQLKQSFLPPNSKSSNSKIFVTRSIANFQHYIENDNN